MQGLRLTGELHLKTDGAKGLMSDDYGMVLLFYYVIRNSGNAASRSESDHTRTGSIYHDGTMIKQCKASVKFL